MRKSKRWIGVATLVGVTAAALVVSVVVKNNLNKAPENAIAITQEAQDLGIKQIEKLTDSNGTVTGYKVNVEAKGFGETPMELAVSFNATADHVTGLEVISQSETGGIGSNVTNADFLDQFKGISLPVYIEGMQVSVSDIVETFSLAAVEEEAVTISAPALNDGTYEVVADEPHNGWTSQVSVIVEGGMITNVTWECVDENGNLKSVMSENGDYKMTEDGAIWAEQAKALAANVIENQGVAALAMDENGKTDAVASVSISINEFVAQMEEVLTLASLAPQEALSLKDGVYEVLGEAASNGWASKVTVTVEGGKITSVNWDCVDSDGNLKSVASENGKYTMTEDGPTWAEQAKALAAFVVENQGVAALTMDENGKTDAVASVSVSINEFVAQMEEALAQASTTPKEETSWIDGVYEIVGSEPHNGWTSQVTLTVEGGMITNVAWDCVDENGNLKSVMSETGEYKMTEDGAIWAEQAKALAANVIENQGVAALTMDENGKTDAVTSVSISINEFVVQVEEALILASGEELPAETPVEETTEDDSEGTKVDAISGATVTTKAVLTAINNAYDYLLANVVE